MYLIVLLNRDTMPTDNTHGGGRVFTSQEVYLNVSNSVITGNSRRKYFVGMVVEVFSYRLEVVLMYSLYQLSITGSKPIIMTRGVYILIWGSLPRRCRFGSYPQQ